MTDDLRRESDRRIAQLDKKVDKVESKVDEVARDVSSIEKLLITEPEASPLGRALLKKSIENRGIIDTHIAEYQRFVREEFQPLDDWWNQSRGAWKLVLGFATVAGAIGAFFGILSYIGGLT